MPNRAAAWCLLILPLVLALTGCTQTPPTITPVPTGAAGAPGQPAAPPGGASEQGSQVIEVTMPPPAGQPAEMPTAAIGTLEMYRHPEGHFAIQVPSGWPESAPETTAETIKAARVFQPPPGNGLLTVTQFDNGRPPTALGRTANEVMRASGVIDRPNYQELGRENVINREGTAMRVEIVYDRSNGVPTHSLILFQIDGTTFSMVHAGVDQSSWDENEGMIRDILASYQVPAPPPTS